jgi:hypothetical protein
MSDLNENLGKLGKVVYSHGYQMASNRGGRSAPSGDVKNVLADLLGNYNVIGKTQNFVATTVAQALMNGNPKRVGFSVQNNGSNTVYIAFGSSPSSAGVGGIAILPGAYFSYENIFCPTNDIYVIALDDTQLTVSELVKV